MHELLEGIRRVTFPLPTGPGHVHCYLLRGPDGWLLVDTGLGLPGAEERWQPVIAELDAPIRRIVVTHFHPDHVGGAADAAALTGAEVLQGELDYSQCVGVWGSDDWPERIAAWFLLHGVPRPVAAELIELGPAVRRLIRFAPEPTLLHEGDSVDGWRVVQLPGHADGHLCLLRDRVMIAGDHLLPEITPAVGLYPDSRPDPLGDYLESLERTAALSPSVALPGHGEPIEAPAARAREILRHHRERVEAARAALGPEPQTAYEVSLTLFADDLSGQGRRFAVAETLSHLERVRVEGGAERLEAEGSVRWRAR